HWECHFQQSSKTLVPCEVSVSPIRHAQEPPIGLCWLIRDITERKRMMEMESANRIKDEFLAIVSHELRSPLNPILGWANLLRKGNLDSVKTAYALETIERNAKLQVQLIEDLLDFSRILLEKFSLETAPIDLTTTIQAALETVRLAAEAKGIELRFERTGAPLAVSNTDPDGTEASRQSSSLQSSICHPPFQILGDSARIQQIVWNLLSNAIKFTPAGGRVTIKLERTRVQEEGGNPGQGLEGGQIGDETRERPQALARASFPHAPALDYAQITVSDTGKGISSDFLPYVFEYFRQGDNSTTRKFGGLGLGLAIVHHLVELHGGRVQAESPGEDQGAVFTVQLPLLKGEPGRSGDAGEIFPDPLSPRSLLGLTDVHVLLVDDNIDTKNLVTFMLERSGAIVTSVQSAAEALQAFEQQKFDVLVSDIGMPSMDGYTLIRHVRTRGLGGDIPAIALTAFTGESNEREAIAAGFQTHIGKPVEPAKLVEAIARLTRFKPG
ncbi:MAG: ATP-binding protein, partial [Kovacikia sp.]